MMKKIIAAAMVFTAVLLCACGNIEPEPSPTPSPSPAPDALSVLRDEIAAIANADVTEDNGALLVTLNVSGADETQACDAFFHQAEDVWNRCVKNTEYDGISFTMNVNDTDVGTFYIMVREASMVAMPPMAYDTQYADALMNAFVDSDFAYGEEW